MPTRIRHRSRIDTLTDSQEIALKQVWAILLKFFGYQIGQSLNDLESAKYLVSSLGLLTSSQQSINSCSKEMLSSHSGASSFVFQQSSTLVKNVFHLLETGSFDDENSAIFSLYHQEEHPLLAKYIPEDLHRSFWSSVLNGSPDNRILRYLRCTGFNTKSTLKWIAEVLDWRINKYPVNDILAAADAEASLFNKNQRFVDAFRRNVYYVRGNSRSGCPLVIVRARDHFRSNCSDEEFEKLVILHFEWVFLLLQEIRKGIDQAHVLFDLTGFTLKNADFHAIKFAVKLFQKCYPDCVERVYFHKAPKIFNVVWNILLKWMKPHLKEKLIFTNNYEELRKHIESKYIPKWLGGKDKHIPTYIEATESNCIPNLPDALYDNLMRQRDELTISFIESTIKWIEAPTPEESKEYLEEKMRLSKAIAQNYVFIDPYIRFRGPYDRNGEIPTISY